MQEPNIKNGCGGLPGFSKPALDVLSSSIGTRSSLRELEQRDFVKPGRAGKQLEAAYDFLLRVRTELHYHANRAVDVLGKQTSSPPSPTISGYDPRTLAQQADREIHAGPLQPHPQHLSHHPDA